MARTDGHTKSKKNQHEEKICGCPQCMDDWFYKRTGCRFGDQKCQGKKHNACREEI